jgi:5-aminopentanamidase
VTCWNGDLRWAASEGIQIALFPEAFLIGHSYDPQVIAARAERLTNGGLEMLCSLLAWADPTVIVGAFERRGDLVTNSAFVIEHGRVIGRYAKAYQMSPELSQEPSIPSSGTRVSVMASISAMMPISRLRLNVLPISEQA